MFSRLFLAAGLVVGLSTLVQAQQRRQPVPQIQFTDPKEVQGLVQGVAPGGMIITDTVTTFACRIVIPPTAKVQVTGTAKADYLRAGQLVEFKAELDDKGAVKDKIGELTVATNRRIGVFADDGGGGGEFGGGAAAKPAKRTGGAIPAGTYRVVGKLVAAGGKFSVKVGRHMAELADEPTVKVDLTDYTLAAKGDKASIMGMKAAGQDLVRAEEVKIELAEPLAGMAMKKKSSAKAKSERAPKRPKKDEGGLPEPAAEK